jgi:D-sedoheptulose 7-phosphate isomerase
VRASTIAKVTEIAELRRVIAEKDGARLEECAREAARRFAAGGRLFAFGNGGSATDAQQLATLFLNPTPFPSPTGHAAHPVPAFALGNDTSVVTALSNDVGVEVVFARQLAAYSWGIGGATHDVAIGLSTSGNSDNLLRAFDEASRRGMLTIGLAGYDGGKMAELAMGDKRSIDYLFVAPSASVHRIQEAQTTIYQVLWELTQEGLAHVPRHTR